MNNSVVNIEIEEMPMDLWDYATKQALEMQWSPQEFIIHCIRRDMESMKPGAVIQLHPSYADVVQELLKKIQGMDSTIDIKNLAEAVESLQLAWNAFDEES